MADNAKAFGQKTFEVSSETLDKVVHSANESLSVNIKIKNSKKNIERYRLFLAALILVLLDIL